MEGKTAFVVYGKIQGLVRVSNLVRDEGSKVVQAKGLKVEYKKLFKAGWICPPMHPEGTGVKTLFFGCPVCLRAGDNISDIRICFFARFHHGGLPLFGLLLSLQLFLFLLGANLLAFRFFERIV